MPVKKPFYRTWRPFKSRGYGNMGTTAYIEDPRYAQSPQNHIRAQGLLLKDLLELLDYIEPADKNHPCYSYRIHELLMRACIEVEAGCKAILTENGYTKSNHWNMDDYKKIEASHKLSLYEIKMPIWDGAASLRRPFSTWASGKSLPWYKAYHATKHDRHRAFNQATFEQMIDAIDGVAVLLSSQFWLYEFSPEPGCLGLEPTDGMESPPGGYFRIKRPSDPGAWTDDELYDFDWDKLKQDPNPFQRFPY
jgi:hypothetical protein